MEKKWTALNMVLPNYFATMQTPLMAGRPFNASDDEHAPRVAILNQTLARRLWPQGSALGKRLRVKFAEGELLEVVGVAADIRQMGLDAPAVEEVFVPAAQMPVGFMTVVARTASDPLGLARAATQAIDGVERDQPPPKITAMTATLSGAVAQRRFAAFLLGLFGALSLALAAIGVSGVMAYSVAQRTREFGVRLAVGARQAQVLRMVLRQGLLLAAAGVAIGLGAAWELSRLLAKMLFGVTPHDPLTFVMAAALLFAVALAACAAPAWRAAGVDPMRCLRCE
ncbi:MAG TPA: FtsX-like permease family protein [Candidatus Sulfopaludibacter sp.]|nr:FtsX-like permease family protein [Candidatus Sulfopaludibacter sp.]